MDLAELICEKARELHAKDIEDTKLMFFLCPNYRFAYQGFFNLLPNGSIDFRGTLFKFTKTNVFLIANEVLKRYLGCGNRSIQHIYLIVCNKNGELFHVRLPKRIVPSIKMKDLSLYDGDMNVCGSLFVDLRKMYHKKIYELELF